MYFFDRSVTETAEGIRRCVFACEGEYGLAALGEGKRTTERRRALPETLRVCY
jgi:hypothetical protein